MFNVRDIISNNNATFYDFNTRGKISQAPRAVVTCFVAIIAALVFPNISDDLLAGFLAVQSILLGFTFNVMFFLLSNRERKATSLSSIESKLRSNRLRDLYHELFYNVSYFNLVAIVSIVITLLLLLPTPVVPEFLLGVPPVPTCTRWLNNSNFPIVASVIIRDAAVAAFYAISMEVLFSIARVVGRTSFYFERKMDEARHLDKQDQG